MEQIITITLINVSDEPNNLFKNFYSHTHILYYFFCLGMKLV